MRCLFILFFFAIQVCTAQVLTWKNSGVHAGAIISFGTHMRQIGFTISHYTLLSDRFQWNTEYRFTFNQRYLGPDKMHVEAQLSAGLLFAYGEKRNNNFFFFGKTQNQTAYSNSVAYAYNAYFNTANTSQQTGTAAFQFGEVFFVHENDLLARPILDRFRTGALQIGFQRDRFRFSVTQSNWTGKLKHCVRDSLYPAWQGYLDTVGGVCALLSHGILSMSLDYSEPVFNQQMRVAVGVDAEQIRHAMQNRFMHDYLMIPKMMRRYAVSHFPMIAMDGSQYLFRKDQQIRKPRLYLNAFVNSDLIY